MADIVIDWPRGAPLSSSAARIEPTSKPPAIDTSAITHPFNKPSADVILRSANGIDFRVHKAILSEASAYFDRVFTLPPPAATAGSPAPPSYIKEGVAAGGTPVINVSEDTRILGTLLRICYPMINPVISCVAEAAAVTSAAAKYEMPYALQEGKEVFKALAQKDAFRAYGYAIKHDLPEQARVAARYTLRGPKMPSAVEVLRDISGWALYRLFEYRNGCQAVVASFTMPGASWIPDGQPRVFEESGVIWWEPGSPLWDASSCTICSSRPELSWSSSTRSMTRNVKSWFADWMFRAGEELEAYPCGEALSTPRLTTALIKSISNCPTCGKFQTIVDMNILAKAMTLEVDSAIAKVRLEV